MLENVLDIRVIDVLRQTLGGTYSPQAATRWEMLPKPTYRAIIDFVSDPKRVDELTQAAFSLLEDLRTKGPSEADVNQGQGAGAPRASEGAGGELLLADAASGSPDDAGRRRQRHPEAMSKALAAVTAKDMQQAAQTYLPADRYVKVVLYPEKFDETNKQ